MYSERKVRRAERRRERANGMMRKGEKEGGRCEKIEKDGATVPGN